MNLSECAVGRRWFLHMTGIRRVFLSYVLTTGNGWQSSSSSWDKTLFLTFPWNWISPQKLRNTRQRHQLRRCHFASASHEFLFRMETYTETQALSLEMSLDFLNSLQRSKRSTQNWWLQRYRTEHLIHHKSPDLLIKKMRQTTYFSCVVKISKQLLLSNWLSIFNKGTETLKKKKNSRRNKFSNKRIGWMKEMRRKTPSTWSTTCRCGDCLWRFSAVCLQTVPEFHCPPEFLSESQTVTGKKNAPKRRHRSAEYERNECEYTPKSAKMTVWFDYCSKSGGAVKRKCKMIKFQQKKESSFTIFEYNFTFCVSLGIRNNRKSS